MKNPILTKEIQYFIDKSVLVLPGICWCGYYYIIYYSIYNFSVFCKNK